MIIPHSIFGVAGTLERVPRSGTACFEKQRWVSEPRAVPQYDEGGRRAVAVAEIRMDDQCKNGHNTFHVSADIRLLNTRGDAVGETIHGGSACVSETFPEIAHLTPWSGASTDQPLHYIANTVYHASNRDPNGKEAGEPYRFEKRVFFDAVPVAHKLPQKFIAYIEATLGDPGVFVPIPVSYHKENSDYDFKPKYTFKGYEPVEWHHCPFDDLETANQYCEALKNCAVTIKEVPTLWGEGKARDFDAARSCAIWPEATDAQLSLPSDELRALLEARLPALMAAFRGDVESVGLQWANQ